MKANVFPFFPMFRGGNKMNLGTKLQRLCETDFAPLGETRLGPVFNLCAVGLVSAVSLLCRKKCLHSFRRSLSITAERPDWRAMLAALVFAAAQLVFADAKPPQPITAVWSNSHHLDLFLTNAKGEVISAWWDGSCGWQPWFAIQPQTGKTQPGQQVTAVWSNPQHLDLFATNSEGRVISTWWEGGKGWQAWFTIQPRTGKAQPRQQVTALWSSPQHLDLFATDAQGRVISTWWEGGKGWQAWFAIHPETGKVQSGQQVT